MSGATLKLLLSMTGGARSARRFPHGPARLAHASVFHRPCRGTGLLFGLYPAWDAARRAPAGALNQESGHASSAVGPARVRRALVCAQVALATLLLIPTGLFLKSLVNLMRVNVGMRTDNVVMCTFSPGMNGSNPEQSRQLFERAHTALLAIPGVTGLGESTVTALGGDTWMSTLTVEGFPGGPGVDTNSYMNEIGPGYFSSLGIPLMTGRDFDERDNAPGAKVAIVNEEFVRYFFGGASPVGKRFTTGTGKVVPDTEIIGVVRNSHYAAVREKQPRVYYIPWRQQKSTGSLDFYLRCGVPPKSIVPQVRKTMEALDSTLPVENLRTLREQVELSTWDDRILLQLASAFAALATALAMLGLYGVMAHSVARRTREIGIRMALGAAPGRIRTMVMKELLLILAIGVVIGTPAALALTRFAESQLFGVKPNDPVVVAAALCALGVASFAAGYVPARRAARVDPLDALRYE